MVMTQTGQTAMGTAVAAERDSAAGTAAGEYRAGKDPAQVSGEAAAQADEQTSLGRVHAIAVTDSNVYSFFVPGFTGIAGVREKLPLAQADLRLEGNEIHLAGVVYNVLFLAGKDAKAVAERASAANPPAGG